MRQVLPRTVHSSLPHTVGRVLARGGGGSRPWSGRTSAGAVLNCAATIVIAMIGWSTLTATGYGAENVGAHMQLPVRGVVRPSAEATISTDLAARVAKIGFKEGEAFRSGNVLIAFDCRRQKAELASAQALRRESEVSLESAIYLEKRRANSRQDVEIARARADKTRAEVEALFARMLAKRVNRNTNPRMTDSRPNNRKRRSAA